MKFRQTVLYIYGLYFCIGTSSLVANMVAREDFWTALQKNSLVAVENADSKEALTSVWAAYPMECEPGRLGRIFVGWAMPMRTVIALFF
jgi:hypothetical protein